MNPLSAIFRRRALIVSAAACGVTLLLAGGARSSAVFLLPVIFMLVEFTGGWIAVAMTGAALCGVALLFAVPVHALMFTVVCSWVCARAIRIGVPLIVPVALLTAASIGGEFLFGDGARVSSPVFIAMELLRSCFNVALVTAFVVLRPPAVIWTPPVRRFRFEDLLFLGSVAASIPAAVLLRGGAQCPFHRCLVGGGGDRRRAGRGRNS